MIVKIAFEDGSTMLFGDSYKKWYTQLDEYLGKYHDKITRPKKVFFSNEKWPTKPLKWCDEDSFQQILNEDSKIKKEHPVIYNNIDFREADSNLNYIINKLIIKHQFN